MLYVHTHLTALDQSQKTNGKFSNFQNDIPCGRCNPNIWLHSIVFCRIAFSIPFKIFQIVVAFILF